MASFELQDYESGERKLSFIPQFKKDKFMVVLMSEYNPGEPVTTSEYGGEFDYDDIVLLRDFLSNTIDLYDRKGKRKEIKKKGDK